MNAVLRVRPCGDNLLYKLELKHSTQPTANKNELHRGFLHFYTDLVEWFWMVWLLKHSFCGDFVS